MSHRRRRPLPLSPEVAHPLDDDDLLHEIMLRLPPQPPHLLRASIISKRWRRLATDRKFLRRFRIHHRKPPLLGDFWEGNKLSFRSYLDPPYRIPPGRFSLRPRGSEQWTCLDCRHGRLLFDDWIKSQVIVWDPITDDLHIVPYPLQFHKSRIVLIQGGAVLCAAVDQGHVHGACHSSPFKVVVLSSYPHKDEAVNETITFASVYSSETVGIWSDLVSTTLPWRVIMFPIRSTLVGNTIHWLLAMNTTGILEFDLDAQRLAVTKMPLGAPPCDHSVEIIQSEDGGVGFASLSGPRYCPCLQMWDRKVDPHGVITWVLRKTFELQKILGLQSRIENDKLSMLHYLDDVHAIFLRVQSSVYMVQLESMQSKELGKSIHSCVYLPFTSFYTEGQGKQVARASAFPPIKRKGKGVFTSSKQKQLITG